MERKGTFEKEMKEREQAVTARENELEELRQKAAQHPAELEKAIKLTEKSVTEKLTLQFETENKLMFKELETDIKLKDQSIQTLEAKVRELENTIKQLSQKTESSEKTVKDIAIKAIESAGKVQIYEGSASSRNKKETEQ
jgi:translation initiation factor 2B subunit (eIF-2B alpha/beta/delta family)